MGQSHRYLVAVNETVALGGLFLRDSFRYKIHKSVRSPFETFVLRQLFRIIHNPPLATFSVTKSMCCLRRGESSPSV